MTSPVLPASVPSPDECQHKFVYGGVKFKAESYAMSGTSAHARYYYDWFYCEKCLKNHYKMLSERDNTYGPVLFGATPRGAD